MRIFLSFAIFSLFLASACSSKIGGADGRDGLTRTSKAARVVKGLEENAFDAEYLEARANVQLASKQLNIGGKATIRLHKDEAIWMSVKKFGFEGARALIRPDSFFVLNRLNGDYTAEPLSYIEEKYKIPARFDLLQEIVLGNAVFFSRDLELQQEGDIYLLDGRDARFATRHRVDGRGFRLLGMELTELAQDRKLNIENSDFRRPDGRDNDFAHGRKVVIEAAATGTASLEMTFTSLKFDGPLAMPFRRR